MHSKHLILVLVLTLAFALSACSSQQPAAGQSSAEQLPAEIQDKLPALADTWAMYVQPESVRAEVVGRGKPEQNSNRQEIICFKLYFNQKNGDGLAPRIISMVASRTGSLWEAAPILNNQRWQEYSCPGTWAQQ